MPKALADQVMDAAWRVARDRAFTAEDLLADPQLSRLCPQRHRVIMEARFLTDTGWMTVIAVHPAPKWALSPDWAREYASREAAE